MNKIQHNRNLTMSKVISLFSVLSTVSAELILNHQTTQRFHECLYHEFVTIICNLIDTGTRFPQLGQKYSSEKNPLTF